MVFTLLIFLLLKKVCYFEIIFSLDFLKKLVFLNQILSLDTNIDGFSDIWQKIKSIFQIYFFDFHNDDGNFFSHHINDHADFVCQVHHNWSLPLNVNSVSSRITPFQYLNQILNPF